MDLKINVGTLTLAIASGEISAMVNQLTQEFQRQATELLEDFTRQTPTAGQTFEVENSLGDLLQELGRQLIQWLFGSLEPTLDDMPGTISYQGESYRRLADKTVRSDILTRFGKIVLERGRYRRGRSGRTVFPLEILLGIVNGFTPAAASRVAKQFATCGSSQGRTLEMIEDQTGAKVGTEKLRALTATLAGQMEPHRESAQVEKLSGWINDARNRGKKPVLSVSRDGVALGLAPWSLFEMAGVGCISVLAEGKKLGTVYLGYVPETNQATLSADLTKLLQAVVRSCGRDVPEIVYVTDAGKVETAYWKNTLRKLFVDGVRIRVTRVVDYYHASERLTTIANALNFGKGEAKREEWLKHVRALLLEQGGHGRVLRGIASLCKRYGYKATAKEDAIKAVAYLRRYARFMNYAEMRTSGYPIGSGVVESACKQIVSERMKLSGMRWKKEGGQRTMTLRCILLSGIWDVVFRASLDQKPTVSDLINENMA